MLKQKTKNQKRSGIGFIIFGSIPMILIGIVCLSLSIQCYSEIGELRIEMIEYPDFAGEILIEISEVTAIYIGFLVTSILFFVFAVLFVVIGLRRGIGKRE